jgi:O-antigen/teichoic acid export membrane protein
LFAFISSGFQAIKICAAMTSLKKLAIRGAIWTFVGYGLAMVLRLGSNLILTRLLAPELFGLISLAVTLSIGLQMFSDVGIGPNIIQSKRGEEPDFLDTAWTLQVVRGFFLWLVCLAIAYPIALFYQDKRLVGLVAAMGLTAIATGFNSTALFSINRNLELGKLTIIELESQLLSLVIMIVWAWLDPSVMALVAGVLSASFIKTLLSYWLIPNYRNRFAWDKDAAEEIFNFGRWIFLSTAMTFLATQADRMFMGKLFPLDILGIYTVAFTFASLPQSIIAQLSAKVIYPLIARCVYLPRENLRAKILDKRKLILLSMGFLIVLLVCFGDYVIYFLYDDRYARAAWMLPILALGIWPNLLFDTCRQSLMALGKPNYQAYGQFVKGLYVCIGLPLASYWAGLLGFMIVIATNDLGLYGIVAYGLWREGLSCLRQDLKATVILIFTVAVVLALRYALGFGCPLGQLFAPS